MRSAHDSGQEKGSGYVVNSRKGFHNVMKVSV